MLIKEGGAVAHVAYVKSASSSCVCEGFPETPDRIIPSFPFSFDWPWITGLHYSYRWFLFMVAILSDSINLYYSQ